MEGRVRVVKVVVIVSVIVRMVETEKYSRVRVSHRYTK